MDILRLRPKYLKPTPMGGGFYPHRGEGQRAGPAYPFYDPSSSQFSVTSTTLLIPPMNGIVSKSNAVQDDISIGSSQIKDLLYGQHSIPKTLTNISQHNSANKSPTNAGETESNFDHSNLLKGITPSSSELQLNQPLNHSFTLPKVKGYVVSNTSSREQTEKRDAETQTQRRILLREYLPGIKDHKIWRMGKLDPFVEVEVLKFKIMYYIIHTLILITLLFSKDLRRELLKNKPASIEQYSIAFCEARLLGNKVPEAHKGHDTGGDGNKITVGKSLIKLNRESSRKNTEDGNMTSEKERRQSIKLSQRIDPKNSSLTAIHVMNNKRTLDV